MISFLLAHGYDSRARTGLRNVGSQRDRDDSVHTGLRNFRRPGVRTASLVPILALAKSAQNGTLRTSRHTIGAIATHVGNRTALVRAAGVTGKYRTSLAGDAFAECILVRARDVNELRSPGLLPPDLPGPRLTAPRVRRGHQSRTLIHVPPIKEQHLALAGSSPQPLHHLGHVAPRSTTNAGN